MLPDQRRAGALETILIETRSDHEPAVRATDQGRFSPFSNRSRAVPVLLLRASPCALLPLLLAGVATAEPAPLETAALSWVRAESAASCPGAAEMVRAIEQRLGRQALVPPSR